MLHALSLSILLAVLWILLSGLHTAGHALIAGLGAGSVIAVVAIAHRMDVIDREGHPVHLAWRSLAYWPWLAKQIAKANWDVARIILSPRMRVAPRVIRVTASQPDELGHVIYANSITLTPGTVTLSVEAGTLEVHALTQRAATDLERGEMDRRVTAMQTGSKGRGQ